MVSLLLPKKLVMSLALVKLESLTLAEIAGNGAGDLAAVAVLMKASVGSLANVKLGLVKYEISNMKYQM